MKQLFKILLFTCLASTVFGQQKPVYERTKTGQVLSDYATWSKEFMLPPTGASPMFPSYVPDSLKDGALWNVPGASGRLKRYNAAHVAWEDVSGDLLTQIPNGRNYVNFTIDGANARVVTSNQYSTSGEPTKFVIFFHFYGGTYTSMPSAQLTNQLLANGYSIATMSATDAWGNEASLQRYQKLYNYVIRKFNVDKQPVAISESMGSLTAFNTINRNLIPFRAFVNIIGVVNLGSYYTAASTFGAGASIRAAYNFSSDADSTKAFFGYDPYKKLNTQWGDTTYNASVPVYFVSGELDTSAPPKWTKQMLTGLGRANSNSRWDLVAGIGHDTAIVTSTIATNVLSWLNTNNLYSYRIPSKNIPLKANNSIIMRDTLPGNNLHNFIDWQFIDGTRKGLLGYVDPGVVGANGAVWENDHGSIGLLVDSLTGKVILGLVNPLTGISTYGITVDKSGIVAKQPFEFDMGNNNRIKVVNSAAGITKLSWADAGNSPQNGYLDAYDFRFMTSGTSRFYVGPAFVGVNYTSDPTSGNWFGVNGNSYFNGDVNVTGNTTFNTSTFGSTINFSSGAYTKVTTMSYSQTGGVDVGDGILLKGINYGGVQPSSNLNVIGLPYFASIINHTAGRDTSVSNHYSTNTEGTWTPTGAWLFSSYGTYIKTGNQVTCYFDVNISSNSDSSSFQIGSLPFTCSTTSNGSVTIAGLDGGTLTDLKGVVINSSTNVGFTTGNTYSTSVTRAQVSGARIIGTITYRTN